MIKGWRHSLNGRTIGATLLLAIHFSPGKAVGAEFTIAVITSQQTSPYQELATGFMDHLTKANVIAAFKRYELSGNADTAADMIHAIKNQPPNLILAIGALATQAALREIDTIPIVAGMVTRADDLRKSKNTTGVGLDFSVATQFEWLHKLVPEASTVGVLYNTRENQARIDAAGEAAKKEGLTLLPKPVDTPIALPDALESMARRADILWGVTDQITLSPQTVEAILLFSFRRQVPFVGLSFSWVKAGALYALDRDYKDLGAQCGELAVKILHGTKPSTLPIESPRKILYAINQKTAEHMKLEFSPSTIKNATQVYP